MTPAAVHHGQAEQTDAARINKPTTQEVAH